MMDSPTKQPHNPGDNRAQNRSNSRVLSIDGALNFRDLGGYLTGDGRSVKWKQIYRSAQLDRLSKQGVMELADLGMTTVVDLRFSDETNRYPTIVAAVPGAEIISWHDEQEHDSGDKSGAMKLAWRTSLESKDPGQIREAMRVNYPKKLYTHRAIYRKMLQRLAEDKTPLVFHCAAGKDRTGVGAALILSLLGVDEEQIVHDYLLTQHELENRMESWFAGGATDQQGYQDFQNNLAQQPKELLKPIFDADLMYIQTLLEYVAETYGNFEVYAQQQLQLDSEFINRLRNQLLEAGV